MTKNRFFQEIHGNFGFGCMRLPMKGGSVDDTEFSRMADAFLDEGFNGMSDMTQMEDNLNSMREFRPLDAREQEAVRKVCEIFKSLNLIPCTSCRYCVEENLCPKGIRIPDMFSSLNAHEAFHNWNTAYYYNNVITGSDHARASECIKCGKCEKVWTQYWTRALCWST